MNLLAAKVLNRNLVQLNALDVLGDFLLDFLGGGVVLERELTDLILDKCGGVVRQAATAKDNGALHVGRPIVVLVPVVAVDGKTDLVVMLESVDLVARLGAVEVNLVVLSVKEVVDGNGVRVAVIAVDGKDAALSGGEQLARHLVGNGALLST